jgi:protein CpxP
MKMTMFSKPFLKPMMWAAVLALCTATLSAAPMLVAQDNAAPAPPPQQQDNMAPPPGGHAGRRGGHQVEMLTKRLNLTPDQVTQVKAIDDDTMNQMKALREDTTTPKADRRSKMMEIRQASQDKIRNVLTDEQKTKYDAMLAKMKERMQNRRGGEGAAPPPPPPPPPAQQ